MSRLLIATILIEAFLVLILISSNYPLFIAKYNYTARTDFDLSFKKGDLLHIVRVDDDGWWLARRSNSQEGCIPSSYVKEYKSLLDAEE